MPRGRLKGAKLEDKDHGWKALFERVNELAAGAYTKVGVLSDDEKGGMHQPGSNLSVAEIAAVNEFGTEDGHVPERSFLRSTFDKQRERLEAMSRKLMLQIVDGKITVHGALDALGMFLAAEVRKTITTGEGVPPPDARSTQLAKSGAGTASAKYFKHKPRTLGQALAQVGALAAVRTLIDTGAMLHAITHAVVTGGAAKAPVE